MKQIKTAVIGLGNNGLAFCERYKKEEWMTMPLANDPGHDFMPEIDHVLSCIIEGRPALVTPREGYCASYTGLLAEKSAREKRAMVVEPAPGIFRSQKE